MPDEGACRLSYNRQLADRADHGSGTAHRLRTNRANENAVYVIAYIEQPETIAMPDQEFNFVTGFVDEDVQALVARISFKLLSDNVR